MPRLGPHARVAFAAVWVCGQVALVLSSPCRADHIFGFRMFPEASTIEIRIVREVAGARVPAPGGEWSARDGAGQSRTFRWRDRVRDPVLSAVDRTAFASYGIDAQLARLQRALDDVADHIPADRETSRLDAEVVLRKNGREPASATLHSRFRRIP